MSSATRVGLILIIWLGFNWEIFGRVMFLLTPSLMSDLSFKSNFALNDGKKKSSLANSPERSSSGEFEKATVSGINCVISTRISVGSLGSGMSISIGLKTRLPTPDVSVLVYLSPILPLSLIPLSNSLPKLRRP